MMTDHVCSACGVHLRDEDTEMYTDTPATTFESTLDVRTLKRNSRLFHGILAQALDPTNVHYSSLPHLKKEQPSSPFPIANRIETLITATKDASQPFTDTDVENYAKEVWPIIHERVWLAAERIAAKRGVELDALLQQMIHNRPLVFYENTDDWLILVDAKTREKAQPLPNCCKPRGLLSDIPPENGGLSVLDGRSSKFLCSMDVVEPQRVSVHPANSSKFLDYDLAFLSSLISMSSSTRFINSGGRKNCGEPGEEDSFVHEKCVYVGCMGARFENWNEMDAPFMLIDDTHTAANGYGKPGEPGFQPDWRLDNWAEVLLKPNETFPTWADAEAKAKADAEADAEADAQAKPGQAGRYRKVVHERKPVCGHGGPTRVPAYLDSKVYKRRMMMVILPFLEEAERRGIAENKDVYAYVVGLGIGAWMVDPRIQSELMGEVYESILTYKPKLLTKIKDIEFGCFPSEEGHGKGKSFLQQYFEQKGILNRTTDGVTTTDKIDGVTVHHTWDDPATSKPEKKGKLLVAMYAWDGMAFPGNEYWLGHLEASGDPAAACCSLISELQNPCINPWIRDSSKKEKILAYYKQLTLTIPDETDKTDETGGDKNTNPGETDKTDETGGNKKKRRRLPPPRWADSVGLLGEEDGYEDGYEEEPTTVHEDAVVIEL